MAYVRTGCSIANASKLYAAKYSVDEETTDVKHEKVQLESPPLPRTIRQTCNPKNILSSVNYYLYCARLILPAVLGEEMCIKYPHCNCRDTNQNRALQREELVNQYLGLAEWFGFGIESQGNGTPHCHTLLSSMILDWHVLISYVQFTSNEAGWYPCCNCRETDPNRALQREMLMKRYLGVAGWFSYKQHWINRSPHCHTLSAQWTWTSTVSSPTLRLH